MVYKTKTLFVSQNAEIFAPFHFLIFYNRINKMEHENERGNNKRSFSKKN